MNRVRADLRVLWATRHSSGFPWPFQPTVGTSRLRMVLLGHPRHSVVPVWRQVLLAPCRPVRYARMVRGVAAVRNRPYRATDNDAVA